MLTVSITKEGLAALGIRPAKIDGGGAWYAKADINKSIAQHICANTYFKERAKTMTIDLDLAAKTADTAAEKFGTSIDKFLAIERRFTDEAKKASSNVRDAAEKLGQGIARIEKAANMNNLERYVALLERAATAMQVLADLQASGKLEKIANAVK